MEDEILENELIKTVENSNIKILPLSDFFMKYGKDSMLCKNKVLHYLFYLRKSYSPFALFLYFEKYFNKDYDELIKYYDSFFKDCKEVITLMEGGITHHSSPERENLFREIECYCSSDYNN